MKILVYVGNNLRTEELVSELQTHVRREFGENLRVRPHRERDRRDERADA